MRCVTWPKCNYLIDKRPWKTIWMLPRGISELLLQAPFLNDPFFLRLDWILASWWGLFPKCAKSTAKLQNTGFARVLWRKRENKYRIIFFSCRLWTALGYKEKRSTGVSEGGYAWESTLLAWNQSGRDGVVVKKLNRLLSGSKSLPFRGKVILYWTSLERPIGCKSCYVMRPPPPHTHTQSDLRFECCTQGIWC